MILSSRPAARSMDAMSAAHPDRIGQAMQMIKIICIISPLVNCNGGLVTWALYTVSGFLAKKKGPTVSGGALFLTYFPNVINNLYC